MVVYFDVAISDNFMEVGSRLVYCEVGRVVVDGEGVIYALFPKARYCVTVGIFVSLFTLVGNVYLVFLDELCYVS